MQSSREPGVQIVIPGSHPNGDSQHLSRPLSVDEALRYSPMTSAPVFALGISAAFFTCTFSGDSVLLTCSRWPDSIIRPDVGHPSPSDGSPAYDTKAAGEMIDMLDNEIQAGRSAHLATAKEGLQGLLHGDSLTELYAELRVPCWGKCADSCAVNLSSLCNLTIASLSMPLSSKTMN